MYFSDFLRKWRRPNDSTGTLTFDLPNIVGQGGFDHLAKRYLVEPHIFIAYIYAL